MKQTPPDHHRLAHTRYGPAIHTSPQPPPSPHDFFRRCLINIFCPALALAFLTLLLVFYPRNMQIAVTSASLSRFNLTSSSASDRLLSFDLSTNLTFRNPNKWGGIYYDWLEAQAAYNGMRYAWTYLPVFYQGRKETTEVVAVLEGRSVIDKSGGGGDFERDNATGVFPVDLWIFGQVRYKFGTRSYMLRALCPLRVPLGKAVSFTICRVWIYKDGS